MFPYAAVNVNVYVAGVMDGDTPSVNVEVLLPLTGGVTGLGEYEDAIPGGEDTKRKTDSSKPFIEFTVTVVVTGEPTMVVKD